MKRFNTYIKENRDWSEVEIIDKEDYSNLLKNECSDFNEDDKPIYRSVNLPEDFYIIRPTGIMRHSAYCCSNHYTLLMNNLPSWSKYPKRTHICSNRIFKFNNYVFRVIPFNGAKIGICPNDDIQCEFEIRPSSIVLHNLGIISLIDLSFTYKQFSYENYTESGYKDAKEIDDKDWNKFKQDIKREKERILSQETTTFRDITFKENVTQLLNENRLNELLKPEGLGFKCVSYNEYKTMELGPPEKTFHNIMGMHEVWLDGTIILAKI